MVGKKPCNSLDCLAKRDQAHNRIVSIIWRSHK
jgi:hypothetical protein